jgi:hypothetical protein
MLRFILHRNGPLCLMNVTYPQFKISAAWLCLMKPLLCCLAACIWIDSGSIVCVCSFSSDWSDLILAGLSDTAGFTQTGSGSNLGLNSVSWNRTRPYVG